MDQLRFRGRFSRRAVALATALLFLCFLLTVGLAFLSMVSNDLGFQSLQERQDQAYYLALSGFDYYVSLNYYDPFGSNPNYPTTPTGDLANPIFIDLGHGSTFTLTQKTVTINGTATVMIVSTGEVRNSMGKVTASRALMAPKVGNSITVSNLQTGTGKTVLDHDGLDRGRRPVIYDASI